jgi:hypothetical protein
MSNTIVAVGCSHTFGSYLNANSMEYKDECNSRSWPAKMQQQYYKDYDIVNLSAPGGSNTRSLRVLKEYILDNLDRAKELILFFGITDTCRIERISAKHVPGPAVDIIAGKEYVVNAIGPWCISPWPDVQKYLDVHYGLFHVDEYENEQLNLEMISLHTFLKHFNVEHYFVCMLVPGKTFSKNKLIKELPIIDFNTTAIKYAKQCGYNVGKDLHPEIDCNHLDHDGNEFLANEIYKKIERIKNGT